jgi:hypothetical protein
VLCLDASDFGVVPRFDVLLIIPLRIEKKKDTQIASSIKLLGGALLEGLGHAECRYEMRE